MVLVLKTKDNMPVYSGWCGGNSEDEKNGLSWRLVVTGSETVNNASRYLCNLYIACAINEYMVDFPDNQCVMSRGWEAYCKDILIENLYLNDVASVGAGEFRNTPARCVHLYPSLNGIGSKAFNDENLKTIVYHGTQRRWDCVNKERNWIPDGVELIFKP